LVARTGFEPVLPA